MQNDLKNYLVAAQQSTDFIKLNHGKGNIKNGPVSNENIKNNTIINGYGLSIDVLKTVKHKLLHGKVELQYKIPDKSRWLVVFILDSSGSMHSQMAEVKGIINKTLRKYHQQQLYFSLIALVDGNASIITEPTQNADALLNAIETLPTGGKTNMAKAFHVLKELLRQQRITNNCRLYVLTDGKINAGETSEPFQEAIDVYRQQLKNIKKATIINTETGFVKLNKANQLASAINARIQYTTIFTK